MGNQEFQGEPRAPAQSSIVQERNKAAISNLNATTQVSDNENVHHRQTYGGTPVSYPCLLYTSPSPRDGLLSRMPSSA